MFIDLIINIVDFCVIEIIPLDSCHFMIQINHAEYSITMFLFVRTTFIDFRRI